MVRVIDGFLGTPKGKIGVTVYRKINGKTFASIRPNKYKASQSKAAKSNRNRFKTVIAFAKYVNSIPELKSIWKSANVNGFTSFNKLVKFNALHTKENHLTFSNTITPPSSIRSAELLVENFSLDKKELKLFFYLSTKIQIPKNALLIVVMAFHSPKRNNYNPVELIHHIEELTDVKIQKKLEAKFQHTSKQKILLSKYKVCNSYATVVFESSQPRKIIYTETVPNEFNLTEII